MTVSSSLNADDESSLQVLVQKRSMNIKCLLHCPEGTFPYLTPSLVEQCFPYDKVGDYLYLGISVNDTCLVPVYPTNNNNNEVDTTISEKENNVHDNDINTNTKVANTMNETDEVKTTKQSRQERKQLEKKLRNNRKLQRKLIEVNKPIGYEFSSSSTMQQIDSWIVPYTRITVPSFDLLSDTISRGASSSSISSSVGVVGGGGVGSTSICHSNGTNPITTTTTTTTINAVPSDRSLQLWTSNGRHSITPEQYVAVATGLQSHITIPLYDEFFVESNKTDTLSSSSSSLLATSTPISYLVNRTQQKHIEQIIQNNKLWIERHIKLFKDRRMIEQSMTDHHSDGQQVVTTNRTTTETIWLPITVTNHSDTTSINEYMEWCKQYFAQVPTNVNQNYVVTGCSFFGWQHITDSIQQKQSLQCIFQCMKNICHATENSSDNNNNIENHVKCYDNDNDKHHKQSPITVAIMSVLSLKQLLLIFDTVANANLLVVDDNNNNNNNNDSSNTCIDLVIGTKLPMIWSRSKKVFVCPFHDIILMNDDSSICPVATNNESTTTTAATAQTSPIELLDDDGCIDLGQYAKSDDDDTISNFSWFNDPNPIMKGCTCLTCQTHSRSYVYHLICAQEILGEILLFIHNLHHFLHLLNTVNKIILVQQTKNNIQKINNNNDNTTNSGSNQIGNSTSTTGNTKKRQHDESEMITLCSFLDSIQSTLNSHSQTKS